MDPNKFLRAAISASALIAVGCVILPDDLAGTYTITVMLISLLAGTTLSLMVAMHYSRELKKAFCFLALFIFSLFLVNVPQFWYLLYAIFGDLPYLGMVVAAIAYLFLIVACINVLHVTNLDQIRRSEWGIMALMMIIGIIVVIRPIFNNNAGFSLINVLFRCLDVTIATMLLPAIFLYRHGSEAAHKESATFTIIIIGIIISTLGDYVYEIVSPSSYAELSAQFHSGTYLDVMYIFSYLLIAVGLYVHLNYHRWSIKRVGDLKFKFEV
jgi:hypothetical protein